MSNKKRNKKYAGRDAAQESVIVKKFEVSDKFDFKQWREDHRLQIIGWSLRAGLLVVVVAIAYGLFKLFT